jgi:hypothetical protein
MFQMAQDDGDSFFVSGKYRGVGSVMKFYKRNAALRWHAQLDTMTRVNAIALRSSATKGQFFGCGQNNTDDRGITIAQRQSTSESMIFSMNSDGEIQWILKLSGSKTDS